MNLPKISRRIGAKSPWMWMAVAALVLWTVVLDRAAFEGWWSADDPLILAFAVRFSPSQYFFRPEIWHQLKVSDLANFTPLLPLSFDFDHALFGQVAKGFYLHQLLVLSALAGAFFAVLELWARPLPAFAGALLLVAGAPLRVTSQELMARHYLEGLLFAAVAVLLFTRYLRTGGRWRLGLASVAFLGAICAKEIFLPLPILLALLPEGHRRRRWLGAGLLAALAAAFVGWRWFMLGSLLGGPSRTPDVKATLLLPIHTAAYVLGNGWLGLLAALLVAGSVTWIVVIHRAWLGWLALAAALVLLPLVPVAARLGPRHQILPWTVACAVLVLAANQALEHEGRRALGPLLAIALTAFAVAAFARGQTEQGRFVRARGEYETTGRFFLTAGGDEAILATDSLNTRWFFDALRQLEEERAGSPIDPPRVVFDEIELAGATVGPGGIEVWAYDPACRCMVDRTAEMPARLAAWKDRVVQARLTVRVHCASDELAWELGVQRPDESDGRFTLLAPRWIGARSLPPRGSYRLRVEPFEFRVRYDSDEGWITYSPPLRCDPSEGVVSWNG